MNHQNLGAPAAQRLADQTAQQVIDAHRALIDEHDRIVDSVDGGGDQPGVGFTVATATTDDSRPHLEHDRRIHRLTLGRIGPRASPRSTPQESFDRRSR